jgi:hypothetical protein
MRAASTSTTRTADREPARIAQRLVVAAGACALACATAAGGPVLVSIPDPDVRPVSRLDAIFDYRTAAATATTIIERDLGFTGFPVTFEFLPGRGAFEQRLILAGYAPDLARTTAKTMAGVGGYRRVLINEGSLEAMPWPARIGLMAHELGHSLQYELGGGRRGTSDQWLREGFADWLSIRVLERLDASSLAAVRAARRREVRGARRSALPSLAELSTFAQWVAAGERHGAIVYDFAFVAVDFLLARHGQGPILEYFRLFAASSDRIGNFQHAFGEDLEAFERAFTTSLRER